MNLQKISNTSKKQLMRGIGLIMLMAVLSSSPCYADEIIFKDQKNAQVGTIIKIDEETVTIRFPRELIQSIVMSREGVSTHEKTGQLKSAPLTDPQLQEKMQQVQERIERLEKKDEAYKRAGVSPTPPGSSKNGKTMEQLLRDEMGRLEGVILWKGKPMSNGSVTIVLERYTGFSLASLKKLFPGNKKNSEDQGITLTTQTDFQGKYIFKEVPPGKYRLYLRPNLETGWVRRLAEKPDLEVIAGQATKYNVPPEKKK